MCTESGHWQNNVMEALIGLDALLAYVARTQRPSGKGYGWTFMC